MTESNWRGLCQELAEEVEAYARDRDDEFPECLNRARAALTKPEPEVADEPTDEELLEAVRHLYGDQAAADMGAEDDLRTARAVLARWGHQPAPPAQGEVAELALKELERTVVLLMPVTGHKKIERFDTIRAALKRLQELENNADLSPAPVPVVADGEVAELVAWLRGCADDHCGHGRRQFTRAADLLEQRHPAPVPVSERLPELRGMFERILCVARSSGQRPVGNIQLADRLISAVVSWSALPLPVGEVQP